MRTVTCLLSILVTGLTISAQASTEAMLNYAATTPSGGSPVYSSINSSINGPVGWTFQPLTGIDVTALGAFSYIIPGTGSLKVGLWNSSGTLLASESITAAAGTLVDQSRYEAITPVLLTAGQTYYVAAYSPAGPFSAIAVTPGLEPDGFATMAPEIQLGEAAYSQNSGFSFPSTMDGSTGFAIIAPNFEYDVVPEPSVNWLLGGGSVTSLWLWRRRFIKSTATPA